MGVNSKKGEGISKNKCGKYGVFLLLAFNQTISYGINY
jgi:hypothetical protein